MTISNGESERWKKKKYREEEVKEVFLLKTSGS